MLNIRQFEFSLFGVNTYVVWDDATLAAAVIDPACVKDAEKERLSDFITAKGLRVERLINTHLHLDHTFGDEYITEVYGVALEASPADDYLGRDRQGQARMFHLPVALAPLTAVKPLRDGDKVWLGESYMEVIAVPGHTPGSLALYCPEGEGWVITGDALFQGSIGRTDLPGGDHAQLLASIRGRLLTLPPSTRVFPGHGPFTTLAREAAGNPFLV